MNNKITGRTTLLGLLGSPVAHSISPLMHNEACRLLGLDYAYLCFDVKETELAAAVQGLRTLGARGWNCTMPDKQAMAELCDTLSPAAAMTGAVNTVVNDNGKLAGHNTDGIGYMQSLTDAGITAAGQTMTLLGAGGAAAAVAVQAALDGVKVLHLFNRRSRSWAPAQKLVDLINSQTDCQAALHDLADHQTLRDSLRDSSILTNGTSVGMAPDTDASPLPDGDYLHPDLVVSDIIYNPPQTKLLKTAAATGCTTHNGLLMLLYQGAAAFHLWTGENMPIDPIKEMYF